MLLIANVLFLEELASSVSDTAGCYFVPAFSGLLCPHWDSQARGFVLLKPFIYAIAFFVSGRFVASLR